ncbi:hypothetical protein O6H91_04G018700 [Diphasiastrum complanatum]|uniref:Uncharacterized protein n=1 Tax=Diphasiastrum complanatum TaxID=34168 RepID=A0ACC2DV11_DIPCM|nr:hypothetical protein O6H91_04G018700 [Diphasiastrum complanatum]
MDERDKVAADEKKKYHSETQQQVVGLKICFFLQDQIMHLIDVYAPSKNQQKWHTSKLEYRFELQVHVLQYQPSKREEVISCLIFPSEYKEFEHLGLRTLDPSIVGLQRNRMAQI